MSLQVAQFFLLILFCKQQAGNYWRESGLIQIIVKPGNIKNKDDKFSIVMSSVDPLFECSIPRQQVAYICVEFLF
jgi:hypothetical protein